MKRKSSFLRCFAIVLVYSCLGIQQVSAQDWDHEYVPFVEEGKVWNCVSEESYYYGPFLIDCIFTMQGDTVIRSHSYKKVLCQYEKCYGDNEQHYYCAVREEAHQVFIVEKDTLEEILFYDFRSPKDIAMMSYGDFAFARLNGKHKYDSYTKQYVFDICAIIDGEARPGYWYGKWLEGVGYIDGNPFDVIRFRFDQKISPKIILMSCMAGDKCVYDLDWLSQPSLITGELIKAKPYRGLFDFQGRRIQGEPRHGMYIQSGKKVIR